MNSSRLCPFWTCREFFLAKMTIVCKLSRKGAISDTVILNHHYDGYFFSDSAQSVWLFHCCSIDTVPICNKWSNLRFNSFEKRSVRKFSFFSHFVLFFHTFAKTFLRIDYYVDVTAKQYHAWINVCRF